MSEMRTVSAPRRREMIAEAAYYRAEKRGFTGGDPVADWVAAEAEVDALLEAGRAPRTAQKAQRIPVKGEAPAQSLGAELAKRLEEAATTATRRLSTLRRKLARITGKERGDVERDVERLADLRDRVRASLKELAEHGEGASHEVRKRAETVRAEVATALERVAQKLRK
jgi:hypothetical protein